MLKKNILHDILRLDASALSSGPFAKVFVYLPCRILHCEQCWLLHFTPKLCLARAYVPVLAEEIQRRLLKGKKKRKKIDLHVYGYH